MSEVTCNTIKDILPLYVDGVVSDDTCNMVAKHLEHCEECKKKYEAMKSEVVIPVEGSIAPLKHFKNAWKKKKIDSRVFNNSRHRCYPILCFLYLQSFCLPR